MSASRALSLVGSPEARLGAPIREYQIDVLGARIKTCVFEDGANVLIPIAADLKNGGRVRAMVEVDRGTFDAAVAVAQKHGLDYLRLQDLANGIAESLGFRPMLTIEPRRRRMR